MDFSRFSIMSITEMLDSTFDIHKKHIGTSALYMFVLSIISMVISLIVVLVSMIPLVATIRRFPILYGFGGIDVKIYIQIAALFIFLAIIFYSIELITQSGIILIGSNGFLNKKIDIGDALGGMFKNIHRILSVVIAEILLFIPFTIIIVGIIIAFVRSYLLIHNTSALIGIIVLGIILIAWFIYFQTIHMYSAHAAIVDRLTFFKALKRSRELVKGSFWRILGSYILFALIVVAISLSIYTVFGIIAGMIYLILNFSGINEEIITIVSMIANILRVPIQILVSLFVGPLTGIFITILYYNQRIKKHGYDIELNLMQLKDAK